MEEEEEEEEEEEDLVCTADYLIDFLLCSLQNIPASYRLRS
jgi:hypothetical protein